MKISPRHDNKKPAYLGALSMLAAATLVSGCGDKALVGTELAGAAEPATEYTEVYPESETTTEYSEVCLEGEITVSYYCFPYESVTSSEASLRSEVDNEYDLLISKVSEIEDYYPGQYSYSISFVYDEEREDYYTVLTAWRLVDEMPVNMVISGGLWVNLSDDIDIGIDISSARSYEDIMQLPCLIDTREMVGAEPDEVVLEDDCDLEG